ncbi:DUF882 domain-containing protein [Zavarzinia sp.]|uniref:DUF882 domain-containing protein n=1 Tax=Zavarzinia sp. TaxID=2027920 RepID=UPI003561C902
MAFERLFSRVNSVAVSDGADPRPSADTPAHSRRQLLGFGAAAVAAVGLAKPGSALAATGGTRRLHLVNMNTQESFDTVYWRDGYYVPEALQKLNIVLRDHRANEVHRIDPQLFDLLVAMGQRLGIGAQAVQIVSAYRAPRTNAIRAAESRSVAQHSFHIQGMALDIRLPGYDLRGIYKTALDLGEGGVGFYRRSGFVHVDTGPVRTWG